VRHVDEQVRRTADWLAEGVDPSGALEMVRRKKFRRHIVRRAQTAGLAMAVVLASLGGVALLARVFGLVQNPQPVAPSGGNTIALVRGTDERRDIFLMSPDGGELRRLSDGSGVNQWPSWSPDGRKIAFIRGDPAGEPYGVYVIGADGRGLAKISGEVLAEESRPAWSPDGARIVFSGYAASELPVRDNFVQTDLYVVDVEGGRPTRITAGETIDRDPAWSPDGSRILFVRAKGLRVEEDPTPEHIPQIYATDAPEGSKVVRMTDISRGASNPAWAPDGSLIAFESDGDIFVMNRGGDDVTRLAVEPSAGENPNPHPTYGNYEPGWSPDGKRIIFVSDRDGDRYLYVMPATGTEDQAVRLTDSPEEEFHPAWQPSPTEGDATPSPLAPSSECPELDEESPDLPDSYRHVGKPLGGDVTGDGGNDRASILGNEDAPPRCRYFVAVESEDGVILAPITPIDWMPDVPSLLMGAEIDGEAGLELVVDFGGPMHPHRTGQVFSFEDGSLVQMRTERSEVGFPMLFPLGGEFAAGVDCGEPGTIVVTVGDLADGGRDDRHFDVTRTFYRAEGAVFVETRKENHTVEVGTEDERWPELAEDPFRSCPGRAD
jgi:Tol biopolymer transport system component